ncbi:ParA family protein [Streptomyces sp. NPDC056297]|uniref:ParA family protein n=1 Tax=unclassified Streptomyces TaxID=2593676 RepID=UPI0035DAA3B2
MPTEKGGREPKPSSTAEPAVLFSANRRGGADFSPLSRVRGKTSTSLAVGQLWAQRADSRILITEVESLRPASMLGDLPQAYTPIFVDCPPPSGVPAGGPVWEEALRVLGLDAGDDHTP